MSFKKVNSITQTIDHSNLFTIHELNSLMSIILGIDPGTVVMGYALLKVHENKMSLLHMDVLKMSCEQDTYERLEQIHRTISKVITEYHPTDFAIEAPFFGKNVQSMLKLGRAQGVAIAVAMTHHLPVTEYSPRKIKQSVTGNGNAAKEQVWKMMELTLKLEQTPRYLDASDALAVAMCHYYQQHSLVAETGSKKVKGWADFLQQHPGRAVIK